MRTELYRIFTEDKTWTFTSSDQNQTYDSGFGEEVYVKTPISRTQIEQKKEITKASVTVEIPIDHEFSIFILTRYSEQLISLTIFKSENGVTTVFWKGRLASVQPSKSSISLIFESIFTSLRRPGLRATFQRNCRFALYGKGCNLNPEDFALTGTLSSINSNILTVPEAATRPDGYFTGGMISASDGSFSWITRHSGNQLTLQRVGISLIEAFAETGSSTVVTIYPGCDHSRLTCHGKFNNVINYGGFDWIPNKNPMGGSAI